MRTRSKILTIALAAVLAAGFAVWGPLTPPELAAAKPDKPGGGGGGGGGKGGGGEPAPPGTIFFEYSGEVWGMSADGSGKRRALTQHVPGRQPSSLVYGDDPITDRWWLEHQIVEPVTEGNYLFVLDDGGFVFRPFVPGLGELFALRADANTGDVLERVQLTHIRPYVRIHNTIRWSNDGVDSFVSFVGNDLRDNVMTLPTDTEAILADVNATLLEDENGFVTVTVEEGTEVIVLPGTLVARANGRTGVRWEWSVGIFQIPISGAEIHIAGEGLLPPAGLDELSSLRLPASGADHLFDWSPDGNAAVVRVGSDQIAGEKLWILEFGAEPRVLWDSVGGLPRLPFAPRWSPDGASIAFYYATLGNGGADGIYTIAGDGSGQPQQLTEPLGL
ncbi:MAG: hypothetical protein WD069_12295 [Planctomycetales bacterium]